MGWEITRPERWPLRWLTLPQPPSANVYYRTARNVVYISKEGKAYKEGVRTRAAIAGDFYPIVDGDVAVHLTWYKGRRGVGDLDNRIKPLLDALQGVLYFNDNQVAHIVATRAERLGNPGLTVRVEQWLG